MLLAEERFKLVSYGKSSLFRLDLAREKLAKC